MTNDTDKSVDLLGLKGIADSMKIVTQGMVDGAGALLSRICLPAAEEFGLLLREKVSVWRGKNAIVILNKANILIERREAVEGTLKAPAQVVYRTIETGSWSDDPTLASMWAGLLASSCSPQGTDDSNFIFTDLISHFSPVQARLFEWIGSQCPKYHDKLGIVQGDHFNPTTNALLLAGKISRVNQLDNELSPLFRFGLFHNVAFGSNVIEACKGLSAYGATFYMRVQGENSDPKAYFKTSFKDADLEQHFTSVSSIQADAN